MRELEPSFKEAGIAVRFVAIGTPQAVADFCGRFTDPAYCIADPDKRTYKAMGLADYNLLKLFTDRDLHTRRAENKAAGFRQNWKATRMKNAAQLPGAAFFDRNGILRWIYRGAHPGDLPPLEKMLDAIAANQGAARSVPVVPDVSTEPDRG